MTCADGTVYEGYWKNNEKVPYDYVWPDGSYYMGDIMDGVPSGLGTRYYPDGTVVKGLWQKGFLFMRRETGNKFLIIGGAAEAFGIHGEEVSQKKTKLLWSVP